MSHSLYLDDLRRLAGEMIRQGRAILDALESVPPGQRIVKTTDAPPHLTMGLEEKLAVLAGVLRERTGYSAGQLTGRIRTKQLAHARLVLYWLAYSLLGETQSELGRQLGDRDHGTIYYGYKKIEDLRLIDRRVLEETDQWKTEAIAVLKEMGVSV